MAPFINPARADGLILRHWSKKKESNHPTFPATPAESNVAAEAEPEVKVVNTEPSYHFAKFNVRLAKPEYTDAQYETHLKSEDWDRSETDYLVELAHEWDLRWVVIADRYEYHPSDAQPRDAYSTVEHGSLRERSMENLKSRYYQVASKIMALHQPLSKMSAAEFDTHQKMTKFDPISETKRKRLVQGLLSRTAEEIQEEELLLGELKRITGYYDRFSQERKELYYRLDYPMSASGHSGPLSSDDLNVLWKTLLNADKNRKHRVLSESLVNSSSNPSSQPPVTQNERNPRSNLSPERQLTVSLLRVKKLSLGSVTMIACQVESNFDMKELPNCHKPNQTHKRPKSAPLWWSLIFLRDCSCRPPKSSANTSASSTASKP